LPHNLRKLANTYPELLKRYGFFQNCAVVNNSLNNLTPSRRDTKDANHSLFLCAFAALRENACVQASLDEYGFFFKIVSGF